MFVWPFVVAVEAIRSRKKRPKAFISKCPQPGSKATFAGTNAAENVFSGFSTANDVQTLLLKFFVTRNALCRVQVKPTTYWPSSVPGLNSAKVAMPCWFVVRRDHV